MNATAEIVRGAGRPGVDAPRGRKVAESLGYPSALLDGLPPQAVASFAGAGYPLGLARVRPGDRVLVLGCGSGMDVFAAAALVGVRGWVTGVDCDPDRLDTAESLILSEPVDFRHGRIERLPFPAASFDVVISNGAIDGSSDPRRALAEAARVLRPGGRAAIVDIAAQRDLVP